MSIAHDIFLQVQNLPEDKAQQVLAFTKFLAQSLNEDTQNHIDDEWAWLDELKPFDNDFEASINQAKTDIQERPQLHELFK